MTPAAIAFAVVAAFAAVMAVSDKLRLPKPSVTPVVADAPATTTAIDSLYHAAVALPKDVRDAILPHLDAIKEAFSNVAR